MIKLYRNKTLRRVKKNANNNCLIRIQKFYLLTLKCSSVQLAYIHKITCSFILSKIIDAKIGRTLSLYKREYMSWLLFEVVLNV